MKNCMEGMQRGMRHVLLQLTKHCTKNSRLYYYDAEGYCLYYTVKMSAI